jgi:ATP-dependent RNA helicase DeaD
MGECNNMLFKDFNLPEALQASLIRLGFTEPTPIQYKTLRFSLEGRDILGSAQTGTGKTGAFVIPIIAKMLNMSEGSALILTPTRELATQILKVVHDILPKKSGINTALLIGGEPIGRQFHDLRNHPRIIVGTPGRVNDHLKRRTLNLKFAEFLVLDETDRMLDMGFGIQLDEIMKYMPTERQTMMFSATLPAGIVKLSTQYLKNPERIAVGETHAVALNIDQAVLHMKYSGKYPQLMRELDTRKGSVIVFVKTKRGAEELADQLATDNHSVDAIHGDLRQRERDRVIQAFRNKRYRIMVATDVAARGLDIPHIEHVINYDLPQVPEDYIHRIGRTARAGSTGSAMSFVSPSEGNMWKEITRLLQGKMGNAAAPFQEERRNAPPRGKRPDFKFKKRFGSSNSSSHASGARGH